MRYVAPHMIEDPPSAPEEAAHDHSDASDSPRTDRWSFAAKVAFRFAFVYLLLYCWPNAGRSSLLDAIPGTGSGAGDDDDTQLLTKFLEAPSHALCSWTAVHVFHLSGPVARYHPTGSGDTTLDYVQVFCFAAIAVIVSLGWSLADRHRPHYRKLYAWLRLAVRFTLAFAMLSYGFAKVFPLQFYPPLLSQLTETYGDASPMGLLWTFMGASPAYTKFSGMAEIAGGLLLLFRRTTTLGALVAGAVLTNVVALNFCYDVPVKLYSSHLLLMSIFLLLPDLRALWNFFVLDRSARLKGVPLPRYERVWLRRAAVVLQILVIASVLFNGIWGSYKVSKQISEQLAHPPLYGVWDVDRFSRNGSAGTPPWNRIVIDTADYLIARTPNGDSTGFRTTYPKGTRELKLESRRTHQTADLTYSQADARHLALSGNLNGEPVTVELHRYDTEHLLLTSRGFHWINEDPFNR